MTTESDEQNHQTARVLFGDYHVPATDVPAYSKLAGSRDLPDVFADAGETVSEVVTRLFDTYLFAKDRLARLYKEADDIARSRSKEIAALRKRNREELEDAVETFSQTFVSTLEQKPYGSTLVFLTKEVVGSLRRKLGV